MDPEIRSPRKVEDTPRSNQIQAVEVNTHVEMDPQPADAGSGLTSALTQPSYADGFPKRSPVKMVKCNCGLELPEGAMLEHTESTGHSKPFDRTTVRIGKIWDLEEAVIENASPECTRCGKPVVGLKRIGKTIYVTHLGCANQKRESRKPIRTNAARARARTCSICWKGITGKSEIREVESLSGQKLVFHEECLKLESRTQLLTVQEPGERYRRTHKW